MMTRNRNSVVDTDGRRQRQRGPDGKFLPKENDELFGKVRKPCSALLKNLMNHRHGWVFNEPVDPSKWEIPDYHVIITTPMDLGTVRAKLKGNAYSHPLEFASDVRLTFANAMKYNPPGHEVHNMAKTLSKIFESKWKAIEEKMSGTQLNLSINIYNGEKLKQASDKSKRPEQNPIPVSGALIEHKFELGIRKPPMTGEMLQNLIKQFEEWTDDIPEQIVAFMKQYNTSAVENGDEIELDFNALNNDALWELQRLVTICLRGKDQGDASGLQKGETNGVDLPVPRSRSQICRESLGSLRKVYSCDNPSEEAVDASNVPPMEFQDMNGGRSKQSSSSSDFESFSNDSDSGRTPSIGSDAYKACSSGSVL